MIGNNLSEEDIIKKYTIGKNINWTNICNHEYLTEKFVRKYQDKVDWVRISRRQILYF